MPWRDSATPASTPRPTCSARRSPARPWRRGRPTPTSACWRAWPSAASRATSASSSRNSAWTTASRAVACNSAVSSMRPCGPALSCASTWKTTTAPTPRSHWCTRCTPRTPTSARSSRPTCAVRRTTSPRSIAAGTRVRLCKGAYQEPASVAFPHKADVDTSYERLARTLLVDGTYPALATHDEAPHRARCGLRAGAGHRPLTVRVPDAVRHPARPAGTAARPRLYVRVYVPFGTEWYPYFMRRLAERPANVLFITRSLLREGRAKR